MRLQVIDPSLRFECSSCTRCCEQPWRTLIEPERAAALDRVAWADEFPGLAGRTLYRQVRDGDKTVYELTKGEGVKCVFLDGDGLCMIHKKLGYDAKPNMCKQFPYFSALAWDADYVSANYGCKAIQQRRGAPATEQAEAIARTVARHGKPVKTDAPLLVAPGFAVSAETGARLIDRLAGVFSNEGEAGIRERLAAGLTLLEAILRAGPDGVNTLLDKPLAESGGVSSEQWTPFEHPANAPMQTRFLFAATMFPDTLPLDTTASMGFLRRVTLVPKLMTLAQMRGAYASRLLGRNVGIEEVVKAAAGAAVTPAGSSLLSQYLASRIWQRFPGGTQLPLLSGLHQHILDVNAVYFYAAARAIEKEKDSLDRETIEYGLMQVEFHLANQPRLYTQVLKGWLKGWLSDPALAWASLRLIRTADATPEVVAASADEGS
jgi:Fe-S-cluster containining protein